LGVAVAGAVVMIRGCMTVMAQLGGQGSIGMAAFSDLYMMHGDSDVLSPRT
jgi:hypothetical protein